MISRVYILFIVFFLVLGVHCFSQVNEFHFSDNELKETSNIVVHLKLNNDIIIGGRTFGKKGYVPFLQKVDTLGNIIWNTSALDTASYSSTSISVIKLILGKEGYLYSYANNGSVWKIDPNTGIIIWKKTYISNFLSQMRLLVDYDSTKFILPYSTAYNGQYHTMRYAFIGKSNGDTTATFYMGRAPWQTPRYGMTIDPQKNIYYSMKDTVYKVSGSNPQNLIWKSTYPSSQIGDLHCAVFDSVTSHLYMIGTTYTTSFAYGTILKISPATGTMVSFSTFLAQDAEYRDHKIANGSLFVTWRHIYVGSGPYFFRTTKYDMASATNLWSNFHAMTPLGTPDAHSGSGESAMSLDVDNLGDVYLTGYYGDANYGPEHWGIMKLDGSTGSPIFKKTIANDSIKYNNISCGMASCIINNKAYFIGDLETYFVNYQERCKIAMIKMTTSGTIIFKKYLGSLYQFPSKTISIQKYPPSKTLVLKQVGRMVNVEMYDFSKNLLWQTVLSQHYFLQAGQAAFAPNGDIYVTTSAKSASLSSPYFGNNIDSIYVFKLNSNGSVISKFQFDPLGGANCFPLEIHPDNTSAMLLYQKNGTVYYRKVTSTLSIESNSQVGYTPGSTALQFGFNKNSNEIYIFGYHSSSLKAIKLDKATLLTNTVSILNNIASINYAQWVDTNLVAVCGSTAGPVESILLYNTTINDTVWTKKLTAGNSTMYKSIVDPTKNNLYTISRSLDNITVRRFLKNNGTLKWTYSYNGLTNQIDVPYDISYDSNSNQLIVTGYESNGANRNAVILTIDTAGLALDTIVKAGDFAGDNIGYCVNTLYDGTKWAGGNRNKNSYGLAGYIYELCAPVYGLMSNFSLTTNSVCVTQSLQLTDASSNVPTAWGWSVSPAATSSLSNPNVQNPILTFSSPGIYSVSLTASNTMQGTTATQTIAVYAHPTITVNSGSICLGSSFTMTPSGANTYTFSNAYAIVSPTSNTTYSISGTSSAGCVSNSFAICNVTVNPLPTITITSNDSIICIGQSATLSLGGGITYTWNTNSTNNPEVVSPTITTTYSVIGTDANGCESAAVYTQSVDACTGIKNQAPISLINIYPNPNNGYFIIELSDENDVCIINVIGRSIFKEKLVYGQHVIDLSKETSGIYIIQISNNDFIRTFKFIKE